MRWRKEVEVDSGGFAAFIHWAWPRGRYPAMCPNEETGTVPGYFDLWQE